MKKTMSDLSDQLKEIARGLSFLGHPRFPLDQLTGMFPQHNEFIKELEDISVPFGIDADAKRRAMDQFSEDLLRSEIAPPIKKIFTQRLEDYQTLLCMMENFDNEYFYDHCIKLYGTSHPSTQNNAFLYLIERIPEFCVTDVSEKKYKGEAALGYLRNRLLETFEDNDVEVKPSTSLLSDSSAGRRVIKLNPFKTYSTQALDIFLVHEGWVHLGTSLNGAAQTEHPWLSTWAPRTTFLQEGLAVLTELITGCMTHERWNRVMLRHLATSMAERGSNIQDIYAFLRHHNIKDLDAFKLSLRIFRGVPLEGGMAFTKELLYLHGMVQLLYHLQLYKKDLRDLWIGKLSFREHLILMEHPHDMHANLRYFPMGLEDPLVKERLRKLQELTFSLFKDGFL
jgi:uncharacterized protein (TIGR02421 family)